MPLVGARFCHYVDLRAGVVTVFRVCVVGQDPEFCNRVEIRNGARTRVAHFLNQNAIQDEPIGRLAHAVHRQCAGVEISGNRRYREACGDEGAGIRSRHARGAGDDAWLQCKQIRIATRHQRDGSHFFSFDYLAHL